MQPIAQYNIIKWRAYQFAINYFLKNFVIYFMDRETIDLYVRYEGMNDTVFKGMSIQELFELRHDMLELKNKLGSLL